MVMSELETFPLEFRSVAPGSDFTQRLVSEHTGGPFVSPVRLGWRPIVYRTEA